MHALFYFLFHFALASSPLNDASRLTEAKNLVNIPFDLALVARKSELYKQMPSRYREIALEEVDELEVFAKDWTKQLFAKDVLNARQELSPVLFSKQMENLEKVSQDLARRIEGIRGTMILVNQGDEVKPEILNRAVLKAILLYQKAVVMALTTEWDQRSLMQYIKEKALEENASQSYFLGFLTGLATGFSIHTLMTREDFQLLAASSVSGFFTLIIAHTPLAPLTPYFGIAFTAKLKYWLARTPVQIAVSLAIGKASVHLYELVRMLQWRWKNKPPAVPIERMMAHFWNSPAIKKELGKSNMSPIVQLLEFFDKQSPILVCEALLEAKNRNLDPLSLMQDL